MVSAKDVDAHVETAPEAARPMLPEVRRTILDAVPSVTEKLGPWDAVLRRPWSAPGSLLGRQGPRGRPGQHSRPIFPIARTSR